MSGDNYPVTWQQLEFEKAVRAAIIEECARVAESYGGHNVPLIAAAIRALKDKP